MMETTMFTCHRFPDTRSQRGQTGVIILLIMAGMLTVGLSLATRTTEEVLVTEQSKESTRIFNAAEAGIEEALSSDLNVLTDGTIPGIEGVDVSYTVNKVNRLETQLFEGVTVSADVTGVTTGQELRVDWSTITDCASDEPASLILTILSDEGGLTKSRYIPLAACDNSDGFTLASTINENNMRRRYDVPLVTGDFMVRVKPIYNNTQVRIAGKGFDLPVQYFSVRSQAQSTIGNETRSVEVNRTLSAAPSVMDYVLYSGSTLVK
jgi:Tfp pilus assembly protein PilX